MANGVSKIALANRRKRNACEMAKAKCGRNNSESGTTISENERKLIAGEMA